MRQVVLDTETTGLEWNRQHRIIEIGCVELINRRMTGNTFHRYLNPDREIDKAAQEVHGISLDRLAQAPRFADIHEEFASFVRGAEIIIHNAAFDTAFLDAEFALLASELRIASLCTVLDSLALARRMHPGQRNSLDALCKRYSVDNSHRDFHGALLDARILAEVYLAMTGGQALLVLSPESDMNGYAGAQSSTAGARRRPLVVVLAKSDELAAHEHVLQMLDRASNNATVYRM